MDGFFNWTIVIWWTQLFYKVLISSGKKSIVVSKLSLVLILHFPLNYANDNIKQTFNYCHKNNQAFQ